MVTSFSGRLVFLEGRKKVLLFVSFRARKASKDSVDVGFFPFIEGTLFALICDVDEETEDTSCKFSAVSTSKLLPQEKQNFAFPTSYILPQMRQYRVLIAAILKGGRSFFTRSSLPVHPGFKAKESFVLGKVNFDSNVGISLQKRFCVSKEGKWVSR